MVESSLHQAKAGCLHYTSRWKGQYPHSRNIVQTKWNFLLPKHSTYFSKQCQAILDGTLYP